VVGIVETVVAPTDAGVEDLGCGAGHVDEQMTGGDSTLVRDPLVEVETTRSHDIIVCAVALVSHALETSIAMLSAVC
jgi:hypothetical protein